MFSLRNILTVPLSPETLLPVTDGVESECLKANLLAGFTRESDIVEAVGNRIVLACGVIGCHAACRAVFSGSGIARVEGVQTLGQTWTIWDCLEFKIDEHEQA